MIKAYPKIFAIGTDYIRSIFDDEVEITEKVDGSQFVFGKVNGEFYMRSKKKEVFENNYDNLFEKAVEYVVSIKDKIPDNTIYYCEYLQAPRHNSLQYNRIPKNHLMLFGVADNTDRFVSEYDELKKYAEDIDIETVPLIYKGKIDSVEKLFDFLGKESILGKSKREGIVVKNYNKKFLLGDMPMPLMAGKYVSEEFKETNDKNWKQRKTAKDKWEGFKDSFRTEARWNKAVQHLRESGELENSPRDIGKIIKEIQKDIEEEEKENIKEFLYKEFSSEIYKNAIKGVPEWYKTNLVKNSIQE